MKKIIAVLILVLGLSASACGQLGYIPPFNGAYCSFNNTWIQINATIGNPLGYIPPAVGLYGSNNGGVRGS